MTLPLTVFVLLLLGLSLAALVLLGGGGALLAIRRRTSVAWRGHALELVERLPYTELWIDGVRVGRGRRRIVANVLHLALGPVPVVWAGKDGAQALYIAGARVHGALDDAEAAREAAHTESEDARWPAARALLESLAATTDKDVRTATVKVGGGLRDALRHLAVLDETAPAHTALGGDSELAAARETLHAEVDRWVEALRALHLQATVRGGSPADVLAQIRAEGEVDTVVRQRARAMAERAGQRN